VLISAGQARDLAEAALAGLRLPPSHCAIIAEHLVENELRGQAAAGLLRIPLIAAELRVRPARTRFRVVKHTAVSAAIDAGNTIGYVAAQKAAQLAIRKAKRGGIALITVTNTWFSGRCGHYVEQIAAAGLIGIHCAATPPRVAPEGGAAAALGTNPIAFGFPTSTGPITADFTTASMPWGEVLRRRNTGQPLPPNAAIDSEGHMTTSPDAALAGALLSFGGHRGYALSFAIQALGLLAAPRAATVANAASAYGLIVLAWRPDLTVDPQDYDRALAALVSRIKAIRPRPGGTEVLIPSERSRRLRAKRLAQGITLDADLQAELLALGQRTQVK
jgi:LDH2 family malate/lactate/ureidoglycolate dehydrogenase